MNTWKTLLILSTRPEAEMFKALLEGNGISAIVRSDDNGGMRPELTFGHGAEIQVQEKDFERAEKIISSK